MEDALDEGQRGDDQADDGEHAQHQVHRVRNMQEDGRADEQQHRHADEAAEHHPFQHRQHRHHRAEQLRPRLAAVVVGYHHHFAAAGAPRLRRVARLVLRHHVLAHTAREQARQHGSVERLRCAERGGHQRHQRCGKRGHGQGQRQDAEHERQRAADGAGVLSVRHAGEIFDDGGKARLFLHVLGNVQGGLLLLLGAGGPGPYLPRQVINMLHHIGHGVCLPLSPGSLH